MKREIIVIINRGTYKFGDNYEFLYKGDEGYTHIICGNNCLIYFVINSNIICGNNCLIDCGYECNVTCGDNCKIVCGDLCNITCGNNCEVILRENCYIKAYEGSQLKVYNNFLKTISKGEEFIWWFIDKNKNLINTFEYESWKEDNLDKWNELYPFVHNELDSATLF